MTCWIVCNVFLMKKVGTITVHANLTRFHIHQSSIISNVGSNLENSRWLLIYMHHIISRSLTVLNSSNLQEVYYEML